MTRREAQLELFGPPPRSGPTREARQLVAALKRVERGEEAWPRSIAGLTPRQVRVLMRVPMPRISVP